MILGKNKNENSKIPCVFANKYNSETPDPMGIVFQLQETTSDWKRTALQREAQVQVGVQQQKYSMEILNFNNDDNSSKKAAQDTAHNTHQNR